MSNNSKKESNKINYYYDFLFEGLMEQRKEYHELIEKAKLTYQSVKATESEIRTKAYEFPPFKVNKNKEFFVWDKLLPNFDPKIKEETDNKENKNEENGFVYAQLKEKFKSEILKENENLINNLNNLYSNKSGIPNKPIINAKQRIIRDSEYYKIYIDDILQGFDHRKTCMIKNIPNKYTVDMLVTLLNEDHFGEYDFLYLRMDFVNECNVGYAFVNFKSCYSLISFYKKIHGKKWKNFSSNKIAELTYATMQGIEQIKNKFKYSTILSEKESYRPKLFFTRGPLRGSEKPFF